MHINQADSLNWFLLIDHTNKSWEKKNVFYRFHASEIFADDFACRKCKIVACATANLLTILLCVTYMYMRVFYDEYNMTVYGS